MGQNYLEEKDFVFLFLLHVQHEIMVDNMANKATNSNTSFPR